MTTPDPSNLGPAAGEPRKKVVAMLLAFFLGWLGAQNWYLGYTKNAKIQLAIGLAGFVLQFVPVIGLLGTLLMLAVVLWSWYEIFCIATGRGHLAKDAAGNDLV